MRYGEAFPIASILLLLLLSHASAATGEKTGEDAAAGSVVKDIIASFSVDSALVPVGGVVELRCRVTSIQGHLVRLYKSIPGTTDLELLTTNRVKENSISDIDRYSIDAEEYSSHGYDFIFRITDARVEDSGSYSCSVPVRGETKRVEFVVVAEPTSVQLYVDGHLVDQDNSSIEYYNVTQVNITCVVTGGHPEPVVALRANSADLKPTSVQAQCRPEPSEPPSFLPDLTCSAAVNVQQFVVDHTTSDGPVACTARSRGSPDTRLSARFTPRLTGVPPVLKCVRSVITRLYQSNVRLVCHIISTLPLLDAHIMWNGQQHLRPTVRPRWPPGVKFDRDDDYLAYLRQRGNETVLELEIERIFPQMFHDYIFVATNRIGSTRQNIALVEDPAKGASRYNGACSFRDFTTHFAHVISLAVTSMYWGQ